MPKELIWKINPGMSNGSQWSRFWNYAIYDKKSKNYFTSQTGGIGIWKDEEDNGHNVFVFNDSDEAVYESILISYDEALKEIKAIKDKVDNTVEMKKFMDIWNL